MTDIAPEIHVHIDPAFGHWIESDVTPDMVRGKFLWVTQNISRVRRELNAAEQTALHAKYAFEDEFARAVDAADRLGAKSQAEAERTATRTARAHKRARDTADLVVKALKDELDDLYRSQLPATQSINRIVLAQYAAEWAGAGREE